MTVDRPHTDFSVRLHRAYASIRVPGAVATQKSGKRTASEGLLFVHLFAMVSSAASDTVCHGHGMANHLMVVLGQDIGAIDI